MNDISENEKQWEKCARLLMLNSVIKLEIFLDTVLLITRNIRAHPTEVKFRTLKYSNASFNSKVVEVSGGVEFFLGIGFHVHSDVESGKCLLFDVSTADSELSDNLSIGVEWLRSTISTCQSCASSNRGVSGKDTCAECTIVIKLPTGTSVTGGFMRGDKLHHIRSFACCYFVKERTDAVRLVLPESRVEVTEALLDCTLEELGLCPRAVVFASIHSELQREALLSQKHQEQIYVQKSHIASVKTEHRSKVNDRAALKEERARILGAFKEDRLS